MATVSAACVSAAPSRSKMKGRWSLRRALPTRCHQKDGPNNEEKAAVIPKTETASPNHNGKPWKKAGLFLGKKGIVSKQKEAVFPLLLLPYEIRLIIYKYMLCVPQPVDLYPLVLPHNVDQIRHAHQQARAGRLQVALLRTCRRVRDEAAPVLYGDNTFRFTRFLAWGAMAHFLRQIGRDNRRLLRSLAVNSPRLHMDFCEPMPEPWMFGRDEALQSSNGPQDAPVYERRATLFSTRSLLEGILLLNDCTRLRWLDLVVHQFSHPCASCMVYDRDESDPLKLMKRYMPKRNGQKRRMVVLDTTKLLLSDALEGPSAFRFMASLTDSHSSAGQGHAFWLDRNRPSKGALEFALRQEWPIHVAEADSIGFYSTEGLPSMQHLVDGTFGGIMPLRSGQDARKECLIADQHLSVYLALFDNAEEGRIFEISNHFSRMLREMIKPDVNPETVSAWPCADGFHVCANDQPP